MQAGPVTSVTPVLKCFAEPGLRTATGRSKPGSCCQNLLPRFLDCVTDSREVAHLSPRSSTRLAVEVQAYIRNRQRRLEVRRPGFPQVAQQVGDRRRLEHVDRA